MPHTADQYRRAAEEARQLAAKATDSCERVQLSRLAAGWQRLADYKARLDAPIKPIHYRQVAAESYDEQDRRVPRERGALPRDGRQGRQPIDKEMWLQLAADWVANGIDTRAI